MEQFIGVTVKVTLKHPPNAIAYGVVESMVPNDHIGLQNVFFPHNGDRWAHFILQVSAVVDIAIIDPKSVPSATAPMAFQQRPQNNDQKSLPAQPFAHTHAHPPPPTIPLSQQLPSPQRPNASTTPEKQPQPQRQQQPPSTFVDPAILHYGTSSPVQKREAVSQSVLETPIRSMLHKAAQNLPSPSSPFIADAGRANLAQKLAAAAKQTSSPSIQHPQRQYEKKTSRPQSGEYVHQAAPSEPNQEIGTKKKTKKSRKKDIADPPPIINAEVSRNGNDMNGAPKRGKGWRSTPFLQPTPQPGGPLDAANTKKIKRKQAKEEEFAQGDTTDIHEAGDFDFESELKKFDKKQVFDEIRMGDTTADEDRLVSHNRVHRPGTHGGKNLHPTEPVLSPKLPEKNDMDGSSDADTELNFPNGRSASRHSISRSIVLNKKKPARQNSQLVDGKVHPHPLNSLSASMSNRSNSSLVSRSKKAASQNGASPRPDRSTTPPTAAPTTQISSAPHAPYFTIGPDATFCPTLLPGGLEALELAATQTFGLSPDALTDIAALHIAKTAISLADDSAFRRPSRQSTVRGSLSGSAMLDPSNPPLLETSVAVVVVLAGNHATGARALAAARHLLTRGFHVIAAESTCADDAALHPQRRVQATILRRMHAGGAPVTRGRWARASGRIKQLPAPPAVIVDALLAGAPYDGLDVTPATTAAAGDADASARREAREMIDWANRSRAPVLAVACPSGVDGTSGASSLVDGEPLAIRPAAILALGAPLDGLLWAVHAGEVQAAVSVADVGVNVALRSEDAVAFGHEWCVGLELVGEEGERRGRV